MKRSDLISKLENYFKDSLYDSGMGKENWILAEEVLDLIENVGMLPPETKATPEDFVNIGFDQEFLDDHDFTVNRWEEEWLN